ncbi:MAG TPA: tryptophan synthase subunit alpha [Candidatus Krumholzibacteria bacterium]|nr:tryptophan synthase subunit alpha [Candidatus Krumholzibacteria bacterium]
MPGVRRALLRAREEGRCALVPYLTMGYPDLDSSVALVEAMQDLGVDAIEIGVPFSDPVADGPTIQRTTDHALSQGVNLRRCLEALRATSSHENCARVLFSYLNPLLAYGLGPLTESLPDAGVGAVLVTDLVPEEAGEWIGCAADGGIETCFLVAPTSSEARLRLVAEATTGFVYTVSTLGVTGVRTALDAAARETVGRVRAVTDAPVAVGFGIRGPEDVRAVRAFSDGVVIGSALMNAIADATTPDAVVDRARRFLEPVLEAAHR